MVRKIVQQPRPGRKGQIIKGRLGHRYWEQLLGEGELSLRKDTRIFLQTGGPIS